MLNSKKKEEKKNHRNQMPQSIFVSDTKNEKQNKGKSLQNHLTYFFFLHLSGNIFFFSRGKIRKNSCKSPL